MTAKEKALELKNKFWEVEPLSNFDGDKGIYSKECALIAVDEILKSPPYLPSQGSMKEYWEEVQQELLKL